MVILAFFAMGVARGAAQMPQLKRPGDTPEEKPPEVKKKPKVKGPRAVGVVQFSSEGKAMLIPIAILVEGKFYDASAYKAEPVPMAVEPGTVYEAEQAGVSQGLFTINQARHYKAASVHPWVGAGAYYPNGTGPAKTSLKAETVPVGLDNSGGDEPPRLTKGNGAKAGAAPSAGSAAGAGSPAAAGDSGAGTGAAEKPGASTPAAGSGSAAGGTASGGTSGTAGGKPSDSGGNQAAQAKAGSDTAPQGQDQNYYRPTLRRGKPTEAAPAVEEETAKAATGEKKAGGETEVRVVAAISDEGGPEPRTYNFFWKTGEDEDRQKQMLALAGDEVRAYASALAKNRIPANAPSVKAKGHKAAVKPVQASFEKVQFRGYDLWGNNQPVMILSAEAHLAGAAGEPEESYSVMLVAKTDIYGNLRKLYSGVTDKFHLDVTPQLELIDAVDVDGDGRGELLFRETSDAGSGYVIYRATGDKLWKMFDSLGNG